MTTAQLSIEEFNNLTIDARKTLAQLTIVDILSKEDCDFISFYQKLAECQNLISLSLVECQLETLDENQLQRLWDSLTNIPTLTSLSLSANKLYRLSEVTLSILTKGIERCQTLEKLEFNSSRLNQYTDANYQRLIVSFSKLSSLSSLSLVLSGLHLLSLPRIKQLSIMLRRLPKLKHLDIGHNNLSKMGLTKRIHLMQGIQQCTSLHHLSLQGCELENIKAREFHFTSMLLSDLHNLRTLNLSFNDFNKMKPTAFSNLMLGIRESTLLTHLEIDSTHVNKLTQRQFSLLSSTITNSTQLQVLDLGEPGFSVSQREAFLQTIMSHPFLHDVRGGNLLSQEDKGHLKKKYLNLIRRNAHIESELHRHTLPELVGIIQGYGATEILTQHDDPGCPISSEEIVQMVNFGKPDTAPQIQTSNSNDIALINSVQHHTPAHRATSKYPEILFNYQRHISAKQFQKSPKEYNQEENSICIYPGNCRRIVL